MGFGGVIVGLGRHSGFDCKIDNDETYKDALGREKPPLAGDWRWRSR